MGNKNHFRIVRDLNLYRHVIRQEELSGIMVAGTLGTSRFNIP
jgi:hypothetical protein